MDEANKMQITEECRDRVFSVLAISLEVIVGLVLYVFAFTTTGKGIPCVFRVITGKLCLGCGMTHALSSIIHGNFSEAMAYNALSITICPLIWIFLFERAIKYIKKGQEEFSLLEILFLIICLLVCAGYCIYRNNAHQLRHTFCTRFCENETNLKVIQSIMGHSDITTTMDFYTQVHRAVKAFDYRLSEECRRGYKKITHQ